MPRPIHLFNPWDYHLYLYFMKRQRQAMQMVTVPVPFQRTTGSRCPIDKLLIGVLKAGVDANQVTTTLVTVTFPCTIVGLRWSLGVIQDAGTGQGDHMWAIVLVRDGQAAGNLSVADAANLYTPEQNVMAFGVGNSTLGTTVNSKQHYEGSTKTMRKMMGGDLLVFVCQGVATNTSSFTGCIQFFCKT